MKAQIVFASMTGNDEDMAEILEENLQDAAFDVENIDVSFADASSYLDADLCVMVTYTYGEGVMTDELKDFYDQLVTLDLSGKKFAVMGSGDKTYKDHYCENVDDFEKAFIKCGAVEVAKPVKIENAVDDEDIDLIDQATEEIVEAFND
ncbi:MULTISPECIES: flavodoxin [Lactobacillus]|uniref:flavodoxin n=1 Tax=Lactobacillus TaxID=1578 RepID=UPI00098F2BF2|nr:MULTISPECIES: flavodoxin [Lactobacillus]MCZ3572288.1 flavodoxin [Lactobacillus gasseri]MCZ3574610.1 flavodoxin [Lactobacillus gasseri]MDU1021968.1 flavodoxin [Lactobacillus paragasseri]MDX5115827.1 flavodoxin [Lactobacillus paragasseri]MDX5138163.1 flavodoxin [Lactobacillus paragasseri]